MSFDHTLELPRPTVLRERAARMPTDIVQSMDESTDALSLLERTTADPAGATPSVLALASAAFRLEPSDEARLLAAMELAQGSRPRSALLLLDSVLMSSPRHTHEACALSHVGVAYSRLAHFETARRAYERLCQLQDTHLVAWLSRLLMSFQTGDLREIQYIAQRLNDSTLATHPGVLHFVHSARSLRDGGEWSPTHYARRALNNRPEHFDGVVRMVANVFS